MSTPKWRSSFGTAFFGARMARITSKYLSQGTYKESKDGKSYHNIEVMLMLSVVFVGNRLMDSLGKTLQLSSKHLTRDTAVLNIM